MFVVYTVQLLERWMDGASQSVFVCGIKMKALNKLGRFQVDNNCEISVEGIGSMSPSCRHQFSPLHSLSPDFDWHEY